MRISPPVIFSSPAIMRSKVDLPQPEGPTKTTNSPSSIAILTPWITGVSPNDLRTSWTTTDAIDPPYDPGCQFVCWCPDSGILPGKTEIQRGIYAEIRASASVRGLVFGSQTRRRPGLSFLTWRDRPLDLHQSAYCGAGLASWQVLRIPNASQRTRSRPFIAALPSRQPRTVRSSDGRGFPAALSAGRHPDQRGGPARLPARGRRRLGGTVCEARTARDDARHHATGDDIHSRGRHSRRGLSEIRTHADVRTSVDDSGTNRARRVR